MNLNRVMSALVAAVLCVTLSGCDWWGKDDTKKNPPKAATGYEITVYQDGVAQPTVTADSYSAAADSDSITYQVKGKEKGAPAQTGNAHGTWVVKHKSWKPVASEKRYEVTLYSGSKVVGTWQVRNFSTDSQSVLLFPADGSEVIRVCGNVVVRSLKGGKVEKGTSKVTLYEGDTAVYQLELSSSIPVGKHLQGEAADGSGSVWIWGNYKDVAYPGAGVKK